MDAVEMSCPKRSMWSDKMVGQEKGKYVREMWNVNVCKWSGGMYEEQYIEVEWPH